MKSKFNQMIIAVVLLLGVANIYFLYYVLSANNASSSNDRKKEEILFQDLTRFKQAIESLKTRQPFKLEEEGTPEASLKQKLTMKILNGTGITGEASVIKTSLVNLEQSLEISVDNTEATSTTTLKFKKIVPTEIKTMVLDFLTKEFSLIAKEELAADYPLDIFVILGTKKSP